MGSRRGKSEGSIYQRADSRWAAVIDSGFSDGRRVRKAFYGPTRAAVAKRLKLALGNQLKGANVNTDDAVSVGAHLDAWLSTLSVRPKTRRQYEQVVRCYLKPAIGPVKLAKLQPDHVRGLVIGLEQRGLSVTTATLARNILRIALAQAVTDSIIERNVATLVRRPKPTRQIGRTLTPEEAQSLLRALENHRLEAVVTCGVALGLRLGEALGLQWADVDFQRGRLAIRHALQTAGKRRELVETKSKESRRTLTLPAIVVRALKAHKRRQAEARLAAGETWQVSDFVFTTRVGRPREGTLVTRDLKRILDRTWHGGRPDCAHARSRNRACLDCGAGRLPALSFHGLRHSCASLLLAAGVPVRDVSELLGHSDTRLTLSTYAHVLEESRARTAGVIDQVLTANLTANDSQSDSQTAGRQ